MKRISFFSLAVLIGAVVFGVVWLPKAAAAICSAGPATVCVSKNPKKEYQNVSPYLQSIYLAQGGTCGPCDVSPN